MITSLPINMTGVVIARSLSSHEGSLDPLPKCRVQLPPGPNKAPASKDSDSRVIFIHDPDHLPYANPHSCGHRFDELDRKVEEPLYCVTANSTLKLRNPHIVLFQPASYYMLP
jgi:hypothetical protein